MSRLLNGPFKPSSLIHKRGSRVFSSSVTGPFRRVGIRVKYEPEDLHFFDASKECDVFVPEKKRPTEIWFSKLLATTLGWGLYRDMSFSFAISDHLNPLASKSKPEAIQLPILHPLPNCQTKVVCNVAMSSNNPCVYDKDWVIAIKFFGRQLNFWRPFGWTAVSVPSHSFQNSKIMYSKRDQKFYLPAPGSNYLCSWDLHFKQDGDNNPKFHKYVYGNQPKLSQSEYQLLDTCSKTEHWVESPTGERFLVKCYSFVSPSLEKEPVLMVYREEETTQGRHLCYTEDIGDVCIFLSEIDPFCLEASSCPGLKPNSIYLIEPVFGVYDLSTRNIHHFEAPFEGPLDPNVEFEEYYPPHWLPPLSM